MDRRKTLSSANARISVIPCDYRAHYYNMLGYYYAPWYDPWAHFQDSFMFGELLQNGFTDTSAGGAQSDLVVNYFECAVTMSASDGMIDGPLHMGPSTLLSTPVSTIPDYLVNIVKGEMA